MSIQPFSKITIENLHNQKCVEELNQFEEQLNKCTLDKTGIRFFISIVNPFYKHCETLKKIKKKKDDRKKV